MSDTSYKSSFESNVLNRKQVSLRILKAKTPEEKRIWRNLLNSEAFIKPKFDKKTKDDKKAQKRESVAKKK